MSQTNENIPQELPEKDRENIDLLPGEDTKLSDLQNAFPKCEAQHRPYRSSPWLTDGKIYFKI